MKKLAKAGRIKLTPTGEVEGAPKNNVLRINKKKIYHESGVVIAEQEIEVNGGHVLAPNSVWRIALGGPKKYHEKVLKDEERKRVRGGNDISAPELEEAEAKEYADYKDFLKEKGLTIAENEAFYAWLKAPKKKKEETI